LKNTKGFTLVEALLAMTIVIFVVVSILSGFTQQMVSNRFAQSKNVAITLAESKLEDYLKFPASQMPASSVDYVIERGKRYIVSTANPNLTNQFRRTASVTHVPSTNMSEVRVMVQYGMRGGRYPFRVVLTSRRGG
jgi:type II secretory pathway pseudopilin PulG